MPRSGKRERLPPDPIQGNRYQQPLKWDKLRERMAEAVEQVRERKIRPKRFWEKDWSKKP